ncbi:hypothetical protein [Bradyrhizobium sp.]
MKLRIPEIVLGVLLTVAVFAMGYVVASSVSPPSQQIEKTDHQQAANEGAERTAEKQIAYYTKWLAWFTGALVAVAGIQGYFLLRADGTARIAANAATLSANAAVAVERPQLLIAKINLKQYTTTKGALSGPIQSWRCRYDIENYGKTPAILEFSSVNLRYLQGLPADPPYKELKPWRDRLIYSKEATGDLSVALPTEDTPHLGSSEGFELFLFGYFIFEDVFGKRRKTGFCYLCGENGKFFRLRNPAYHYDRDES